MRAEHATFSMYSRACVQTEACPPKLLCGFDSTEKEGPSLPRVWYNESELTKHDLQLPQSTAPNWKQFNKQHWFFSTYALSVQAMCVSVYVCVCMCVIICFTFYAIEYRTSPGFSLCPLSFRTRAGNTTLIVSCSSTKKNTERQIFRDCVCAFVHVNRDVAFSCYWDSSSTVLVFVLIFLRKILSVLQLAINEVGKKSIKKHRRVKFICRIHKFFLFIFLFSFFSAAYF